MSEYGWEVYERPKDTPTVKDIDDAFDTLESLISEKFWQAKKWWSESPQKQQEKKKVTPNPASFDYYRERQKVGMKLAKEQQKKTLEEQKRGEIDQAQERIYYQKYNAARTKIDMIKKAIEDLWTTHAQYAVLREKYTQRVTELKTKYPKYSAENLSDDAQSETDQEIQENQKKLWDLQMNQLWEYAENESRLDKEEYKTLLVTLLFMSENQRLYCNAQYPKLYAQLQNDSALLVEDIAYGTEKYMSWFSRDVVNTDKNNEITLGEWKVFFTWKELSEQQAWQIAVYIKEGRANISSEAKLSAIRNLYLLAKDAAITNPPAAQAAKVVGYLKDWNEHVWAIETPRKKALCGVLQPYLEKYGADFLKIQGADRKEMLLAIVKFMKQTYWYESRYATQKHTHKKGELYEEAIQADLLRLFVQEYTKVVTARNRALLQKHSYTTEHEYHRDCNLVWKYEWQITVLYQNLWCRLPMQEFMTHTAEYSREQTTLAKKTGYGRALTADENKDFEKMRAEKIATESNARKKFLLKQTTPSLATYHGWLAEKTTATLQRIQIDQEKKYQIAIPRDRPATREWLKNKGAFTREDMLLYLALLPLVEHVATVQGRYPHYLTYATQAKQITQTYTVKVGVSIDKIELFFEDSEKWKKALASQWVNRDRFVWYSQARARTPYFLQEQMAMVGIQSLVAKELNLQGSTRFPHTQQQHEELLQKQAERDARWATQQFGTQGVWMVLTTGIWNGFIKNTYGAWANLWYMVMSHVWHGVGNPARAASLDDVLAFTSKEGQIPISTLMQHPLSSDGKLTTNFFNYPYAGGETIGQVLALAVGWTTKLGTFWFAALTQLGNYYIEGEKQFNDTRIATYYALMQAGVAGVVEKIMPDRDLVFWWIRKKAIDTLLSKELIRKTVCKTIMQQHLKEQLEEQVQGVAEETIQQGYELFLKNDALFPSLTWADAEATALVTLFTMWFGAAKLQGMPTKEAQLKAYIDQYPEMRDEVVSRLEAMKEIDTSNSIAIENVLAMINIEPWTTNLPEVQIIPEEILERPTTDQTTAQIEAITQASSDTFSLQEKQRIEENSDLSPEEKWMLLLLHFEGREEKLMQDWTKIDAKSLWKILDEAHMMEWKLFELTPGQIRKRVAFLQKKWLSMEAIKIALQEWLCGQYSISSEEKHEIEDIKKDINDKLALLWFSAPDITDFMDIYLSQEMWKREYIRTLLKWEGSWSRSVYWLKITQATSAIRDWFARFWYKDLNTFLQLYKSVLSPLPTVERAKILAVTLQLFVDTKKIENTFTDPEFSVVNLLCDIWHVTDPVVKSQLEVAVSNKGIRIDTTKWPVPAIFIRTDVWKLLWINTKMDWCMQYIPCTSPWWFLSYKVPHIKENISVDWNAVYSHEYEHILNSYYLERENEKVYFKDEFVTQIKDMLKENSWRVNWRELFEILMEQRWLYDFCYKYCKFDAPVDIAGNTDFQEVERLYKERYPEYVTYVKERFLFTMVLFYQKFSNWRTDSQIIDLFLIADKKMIDVVRKNAKFLPQESPEVILERITKQYGQSLQQQVTILADNWWWSAVFMRDPNGEIIQEDENKIILKEYAKSTRVWGDRETISLKKWWGNLQTINLFEAYEAVHILTKWRIEKNDLSQQHTQLWSEFLPETVFAVVIKKLTKNSKSLSIDMIKKLFAVGMITDFGKLPKELYEKRTTHPIYAYMAEQYDTYKQREQQWNMVLQPQLSPQLSTYQAYINAGNAVCVYAAQSPYNKLLQIKWHFDAANRELSPETEEIMYNPQAIWQRVSVSASLISQEHTRTRWPYGIGIAWSYNNVVHISNLDAWTQVDAGANRGNIERTPADLLSVERARYGYNEILLMNTPNLPLKPSFVFIKTHQGKPVIAEYLQKQLIDMATAQNLEIVYIEESDEDVRTEKTCTYNFYNGVPPDISLKIKHESINYAIWWSAAQHTYSFTKRWVAMNLDEIPTYAEVKLMKTALEEKIKTVTDSFQKQQLQKIAETMLDEYKNSLLSFDPTTWILTVTITNTTDRNRHIYTLDTKNKKTQTQTILFPNIVRPWSAREMLPLEEAYIYDIAQMVLDPNNEKDRLILEIVRTYRSW